MSACVLSYNRGSARGAARARFWSANGAFDTTGPRPRRGTATPAAPRPRRRSRRGRGAAPAARARRRRRRRSSPPRTSTRARETRSAARRPPPAARPQSAVPELGVAAVPCELIRPKCSGNAEKYHAVRGAQGSSASVRRGSSPNRPRPTRALKSSRGRCAKR